MKHYIDSVLSPDPEFVETTLMNALMSKLHKALHELASTSIGVSFPNYQVTLGNKLRIHGTESDLKNLQAKDWLGGMKGYCEITDIKPIPSKVKYRTVSRKQTTMSQAKLRRLIKRKSITEEEIKQYKAKMFSKGLDNPYLEIVSNSNHQKHRRYIEFGELTNNPTNGEFDSFGLSKTATIPWF